MDTSEWLKLELSALPNSLKPGDKGELILTVAVPEGCHVESNHPSEKFLIPTELILNPIDSVHFGDLVYPEDEEKGFSWSETVLKVYSSTFEITVPFAVSETAQPGKVTVTGQIKYQGCTPQFCLTPNSQKVETELEINSTK